MLKEKNMIKIFSTDTTTTYLTQDKNLLINRRINSGVLNKNLLLLKDINKMEYTLTILKIHSDVVIQAFEEYIPILIYNGEWMEFLESFVDNLIIILKSCDFFQEIIEFIDPEAIWINYNMDIKICWLTIVLKYSKFFDNSVHKINLDSVENLIKLIKANRKRLKKRTNEIIFTQEQIINENTLHDEELRYIENLKILLIKVMYRTSDVNHKNIANYKSKIRNDFDLRYKAVNFILNGLWDPMDYNVEPDMFINVFINEVKTNLKQLEIENKCKNNIFDSTSSKDYTETNHLNNDFENDYKEIFEINNNNNLKNKTTTEKNQSITENIKKSNPNDINVKDVLENNSEIFEQKGFNMNKFDTKTYKKGRFFVCEAVPNAKLQDNTKNIKKLCKVLDIQNQQIQMIYQSLKNRVEIENQVDEQLSALSIKANEVFEDLSSSE